MADGSHAAVNVCVRAHYTKMEIRWYPIVRRPLFEIEIERFTFIFEMISVVFWHSMWVLCCVDVRIYVYAVLCIGFCML